MPEQIVRKPFGLSFIGFEPTKVTRPLMSHIPPVKDLVLFHSDHPRTLQACESLTKSLTSLGISPYFIQLHDIFNYFEVFTAAENVRNRFGDPEWINTTAGPGIAASALSLMGTIHNIDLIAYDSEGEKTRMVPMAQTKNFFMCRPRHVPLLELVKKNPHCTLDFLADSLLCSKATVSRAVSLYRRLELIGCDGSGRGASPYRVYLTALGLEYVSNPHDKMNTRLA